MNNILFVKPWLNSYPLLTCSNIFHHQLTFAGFAVWNTPDKITEVSQNHSGPNSLDTQELFVQKCMASFISLLENVDIINKNIVTKKIKQMKRIQTKKL